MARSGLIAGWRVGRLERSKRGQALWLCSLVAVKLMGQAEGVRPCFVWSDQGAGAGFWCRLISAPQTSSQAKASSPWLQTARTAKSRWGAIQTTQKFMGDGCQPARISSVWKPTTTSAWLSPRFALLGRGEFSQSLQFVLAKSAELSLALGVGAAEFLLGLGGPAGRQGEGQVHGGGEEVPRLERGR